MSEDEGRRQTRPFADWLRDHKQGALHDEVSKKLAELAVLCLEREKVGTLSIKLKLTPSKDGVTLFIEDTVNVTEPPAARGGSTFYADGEGNLTRTDPRQLTLDDAPLRVVETKDEEPILVDTGSGEVLSID